MLVGGANQAEANDAEAEFRAVVVPVSNLRVGAAEIPRTATKTATAVRPRLPACARRRARYVSVPVPVPAPFPHVPAHVVKSVAVLFLCLHFPRSCTVRVRFIPCDIIDVIASGVRVVSPTSTSPLPFRFRRKPVAVGSKVACSGVPGSVLSSTFLYLWTLVLYGILTFRERKTVNLFLIYCSCVNFYKIVSYANWDLTNRQEVRGFISNFLFIRFIF